MTDLPRPHGIKQLAFHVGYRNTGNRDQFKALPQGLPLHPPCGLSHLMQDNQHVAVSHDMDGTHDVIEDVNTTSIYDYIVNYPAYLRLPFTITL